MRPSLPVAAQRFGPPAKADIRRSRRLTFVPAVSRATLTPARRDVRPLELLAHGRQQREIDEIGIELRASTGGNHAFRFDESGAGANQLTVGGELNKLAANIAIARNMAGVHWRSDYVESIALGEKIALGVLQEQSITYNEPSSFSLVTFGGEAVHIADGKVRREGPDQASAAVA